MGRSPCCSKEGLNRGAWTALEDKILSDYIKIHGEGRWRNLPQEAGLKRCGKSCRLRWLNYLRPDIKRGNISPDEEELIIRLHKLLGNRWSLIAGRLPGRTDNEIKNYWNTNLGKKVPHHHHHRHHKQQQNTKADRPNSTSPLPEHVVRTKAVKCTKVVLVHQGHAGRDSNALDTEGTLRPPSSASWESDFDISNCADVPVSGSEGTERNINRHHQENVVLPSADSVANFDIDEFFLASLDFSDFPRDGYNNSYFSMPSIASKEDHNHDHLLFSQDLTAPDCNTTSSPAGVLKEQIVGPEYPSFFTSFLDGTGTEEDWLADD